ncbi:ClbS/DfsB family four-helix bundle protein [Paenibacillus donghaensis]|uniref:Cytoplasmic protein n=1 Tax=Paenibacillus donghaensis TaxID=414771 RepID=A0A2Z2K848_9BACL|nr:ClbS/DfsB family four-helix bundle protein [Paenibacillus donghaensis]ASA19385.1 cytoplasmic protein [Paenibacillus donghaensis]
MGSYGSKQELIDEIKNTYAKLDAEFDQLPEALKDKRVDEVDRTPSEVLSYQLGWIHLLLQWDQDEQQGLEVQTPAPGYKWNNLGGLYLSFYEKYGQYSLEEQRRLLADGLEELYCWIASLSDEELNKPNQRKWATTNAMWPVEKWIHINTVAPFKSFRAKIRKWKKIALQ